MSPADLLSHCPLVGRLIESLKFHFQRMEQHGWCQVQSHMLTTFYITRLKPQQPTKGDFSKVSALVVFCPLGIPLVNSMSRKNIVNKGSKTVISYISEFSLKYIPPLTKNLDVDLPIELSAKHNNCTVTPLKRKNSFVIVMNSSVFLDISIFALDWLIYEPIETYLS